MSVIYLLVVKGREDVPKLMHNFKIVITWYLILLHNLMTIFKTSSTFMLIVKYILFRFTKRKLVSCYNNSLNKGQFIPKFVTVFYRIRMTFFIGTN